MRAQTGTGTKNVGTIERVSRVVLGGALAAWALWLLLGGGPVVWLLLYVALVALGVDFVVTGHPRLLPAVQVAGLEHRPAADARLGGAPAMQHDTGDAEKGGWKSWLLMAACCIPMVAVVVLAALGYWSLP